MLAALIVFAQEAKEVVKDAAAKGGSDSPLGEIFRGPIFPLMLIFGAFYFLMIRPAQQREKKQREEIFANLKKNDEVVTSSGFIAIVHSVVDDEVVIKLDENSKARILKSTIVQIRNKKEEPPSTAAPK